MTIKDAAGLFVRHKKTAAFLCGLIAVGALPPYYATVCLLPAFAGLVALLNRTEGKKQAAATGFWFGFGFFSLGLAWVSNAMLIDGMGFGWLAPLPPVGFGLWGGLFGAAAAFTAAFFKAGWRRLTAFGAAWGVFEWVRSWLFTGFPWNLVASVWTDRPEMMQSASLAGAYGLGIATVFIAGLPALVGAGWRRFVPPLALGVILLASLWGYGAVRLTHAPDDTINGAVIRLVQANIPQGRKWNADEAERNLMKHVHLSRSSGAEKVSHVVWPETATRFLLVQDDFARSMVTSALTPSAILLAGTLRAEKTETGARYFNSVAALNDLGVYLGGYDKSHLVPFGEYVPLAKFFPFIRKVTPVPMDLGVGYGVKTTVLPRTLPVGILVCYEVIFPANVAERNYRPYWLLNVTNDGWYGLSAGPYQHFAAAQMRAVEEGLPLARAANTGISGMIDAYGRVTASLGLGKEGVVDAGLPRRTKNQTFYAKHGNAVPLTLALLLFILAAVPFKREKGDAA